MNAYDSISDIKNNPELKVLSPIFIVVNRLQEWHTNCISLIELEFY